MKKWLPVVIVCGLFWWMSVATSKYKEIALPACQRHLMDYVRNNPFPEMRSFSSIFYDGTIDTMMLFTNTPLSLQKTDSLNETFCKIYKDSCSVVQLTIAYVDSATISNANRNFSLGYAYRFYSCP